ncbi:hypothetical protein ARMGADRAFT_1029430 [Armillaria gallica]|uniref:Uncharacterized protein n=1 Tax=Armillaria gallica TaxID=47427 RepID=A0A2H3DGE4_ARMGA|nr:hypothetical protein ARMGADRAFT_1029430 [Armillaria gallica]
MCMDEEIAGGVSFRMAGLSVIAARSGRSDRSSSYTVVMLVSGKRASLRLEKGILVVNKQFTASFAGFPHLIFPSCQMADALQQFLCLHVLLTYKFCLLQQARNEACEQDCMQEKWPEKMFTLQEIHGPFFSDANLFIRAQNSTVIAELEEVVALKGIQAKHRVRNVLDKKVWCQQIELR